MSHEKLELRELKEGDSFHVKAGQDPKAFTYIFRVTERGEMPLCELTQLDPQGKSVGPHIFRLEGTGNWTTPEQNPTQREDLIAGKFHQALAMSIGYGIIRVGGFLIVSDPNSWPLQRAELMPECTQITLGTF